MSKRWDEAIEAAGQAWLSSNLHSNPDLAAKEVLDAFALAAHGPSGPAALRDWVEGRAVLVNLNLLYQMAEDAGAGHRFWVELFKPRQPPPWNTATPAAPDGEPK